MSQQEGSYCLVHCVDSLIIWLLVDYKKGGTHTQTHTHVYTRPCPGLQWGAFPHSRRQTKAQGKRNWWGQRNYDKGCCEKQLLSAASFLYFPLALAHSLSRSICRFKPPLVLNWKVIKIEHIGRGQCSILRTHEFASEIIKKITLQNYRATRRGISHHPRQQALHYFKLDIVSLGVNHSKNFDFI